MKQKGDKIGVRIRIDRDTVYKGFSSDADEALEEIRRVFKKLR